MQLLILIGAVFFISFVGIVLFGAPFIPTKRRQIKIALDILNLEPGEVLFELGAGDGRVALAASDRGVRVEAFELNPLLFTICWLRTIKRRHLVKVHLRNYWQADFGNADAIFIFSGEIYMKRLVRKLSKVQHRLKLVSFAFKLPDITPVKHQEAIFMYEYPLAKQRRHR